jgi:hypothetical protein
MHVPEQSHEYEIVAQLALSLTLKPKRENILLFHNCIQYQQKMQQAIDLDPAKNTVTIAGSRIILSNRRLIRYTRNRSSHGMLGSQQ